MQAVRFVGVVGRPAQIEDVRKPSPGPGQVLIGIGGAGVCHSDLHVMGRTSDSSLPSRLATRTQGGWIRSAKASPDSKKAALSPSMVRGAAAAATRASSQWRTTARIGPN
jgi:hypothetical protein